MDLHHSRELTSWIQSRIKITGFHSGLWTVDHDEATLEFLTNPSSKSLFFSVENGKSHLLIVTLGAPPTRSPFRKDVGFFIRAEGDSLTPSNIDDVLLFGTFALDQSATSVLHIMDKVFYPHIFYTRDWSISTRTELMGLYHRFMSSLTESSSEEIGKTTLYLPFRGDFNFEYADFENIDKNIIQQLESIAIHWLRQIKAAVNNYDVNSSNEGGGPIQELNFWKYRALDLKSLSAQLQCLEVKKILSLLIESGSKYVEPIHAITQLIEKGSKEASDIVKYLEILQEPCKELSLLDPFNIPSLFPRLLNCTRVIYTLSSNYNTYDRISGLLRRICNQIIRRCSSHIILNEVFHGDVGQALTILDVCMKCGIEFKALYNKTTVTINKQINTNTNSMFEWKSNDPSIFAELDAFIQRCDDLMSICHGREQFVSCLRKNIGSLDDEKQFHFRGTSALDIETSLGAVSDAFYFHIARFKNLEYNILDVTISQWHEDFNNFKIAMKDLDRMMINIMNTAFEPVRVIEYNVLLVDLFNRISHRPSIKRCLEKKMNDIVDIFLKECVSVRQEFDDLHRNPPLRLNEPLYAGSALWSRALYDTIRNDWLLLKRMPIKNGLDNVESICENLLSSLLLYQEQKYQDWLVSLSSIDANQLQERLDLPILRWEGTCNSLKNKVISSIVSNFDVGLADIFSETIFWDKFHIDQFEIPKTVISICHQRESLRVIREKVMKIVRAYNSLLEDVSSISLLFIGHIHMLERKLYPGFSKLLWSSRLPVIDRFVQSSLLAINELHRDVRYFHQSTSVIKEQILSLSNLRFINIDASLYYKDDLFEKKQVEFREISKVVCIESHRIVQSEVSNLMQLFHDSSDEVKSEWERKIAEFNEDFKSAIIHSVKNSLRDLFSAMDVHEHTRDTHPLFTCNIWLRNNNIECKPSLIEITNVINRLAKEVIGVFKDFLMFYSKNTNNNGSNDSVLNKPTVGYFYDQLSSDPLILNILSQIMNRMALAASDIQTSIARWEQYKVLWDMDKGSYFRKYCKDKPPVETFAKDISHFRTLQSSIESESSISVKSFIQLNYSSLKSVLAGNSIDVQDKLVNLLHSNTKSECEKFHEYIGSSIYKLQRPIRNAIDLKDRIDEVAQAKQDCSGMQKEFIPLQSAFKTIESFGKVVVDQKSKDVLQSLKPRLDLLLERIDIAEIDIEKSKVTLKTELHSSIKEHSDKIVELCQKVDENLTRKGDDANIDCKNELDTFLNDLERCKMREAALKPGLLLFGVDLPDVKRYTVTKIHLDLMQEVVKLSKQWNCLWQDWLVKPFCHLDISLVETISDSYHKELMKMRREIRTWPEWGKIWDKVELLKSIIPLIKNLLNTGMRERHWDKIRNLTSRAFQFSNENFSLEDIFLLGLQDHAKSIEEITAIAKNELTIESNLNEIEVRRSEIMIEFHTYKDTYKIKSVDEIFSILEDDSMTLASIKTSRFARFCLDRVAENESKIAYITEFLEMWLTLQRKWLHLETIFVGSGDIKKRLPIEYDTFQEVSNKYKCTVNQLHNSKSLIAVCSSSYSVGDINSVIEKIENIEKSLDRYLEGKRFVFPRFYFMSDDDLLDLIGKSADISSIQPHIKKCFEGVHNLSLSNESIISVTAPDGESIILKNKVSTNESVELWLSNVLDELKTTMKLLLCECLHSMKENTKEDWISTWPGQLIITAGAITLARNCTRALIMMRNGEKNDAIYASKKKQIKYIKLLTNIVRDHVLPLKDREKLVALITAEIHNRDVIEQLIKVGSRDPDDFSWTKQLRFYHDSKGDKGECRVQISTCSMPYGYEYQGNNGRLVVTPLTDRCILTLLTSKFLFRAGNPIGMNLTPAFHFSSCNNHPLTILEPFLISYRRTGPAGTGKTETVKDLAKSLAYFCIVCNCSEELDYISIGRLFSGLCQSGAWGCFDEFNRIRVEVISVVASQISSIFNTQQKNLINFNFMGNDIKCSPDTGIFVTLNPGYAGRTELPENMKTLIRPIAMMAPDLPLIIEVILSSEGFHDARALSRKIVCSHSLMKQQLSEQIHYDYSLRNIKSVLHMAGKLKLKMRDYEEDVIIIHALKIVNLPKLIKSDETLYLQLLRDIFPHKWESEMNSINLDGRIRSQLDLKKFHHDDHQIRRIIDLAHSQNNRHCNMLLGKTMSGKSTIWKILSEVIPQMEKGSEFFASDVKKFIVNPISLSVSELYGSYNSSTLEWSDGVISSIFKICTSDDTEDVSKWIILDGPVDALWIESMNSVMDDNKVLTLVNGDRIHLSQSMSLLFEVEDLAVASPATVSRAGMIYVDRDLGWQSYMTSWIKCHPSILESEGVFIEALCHKYFDVILEQKWRTKVELFRVVDLHGIVSFFDMFEALVLNNNIWKKESYHSDSSYQKGIEKWFIFCLIWSLGATVDENGRLLIDHCVRDIDSRLLPPRSLYDYFIDPKSNEFELWEKKIVITDSIMPHSSHMIIVPTVDTIRNNFVVSSIIHFGRQVLVGGKIGTGKSLMMRSILDSQPDTVFQKTINLSHGTKSIELQKMLETSLERRAKNKLGPMKGKKNFLVFIDDLNMPKLSSIESPYQPPLELIRQLIEYKGWYDRSKYSWNHVMNTQIIAAMSYSTLTRGSISDRVKSKFFLFNNHESSRQIIESVFQNVFLLKWGKMRSEIKSLIKSISKVSYTVYEKCKELFLPTPVKAHYLFSLKDIFKVIEGMLLWKPDVDDSKDTILRLWFHECMRCFSDRFIHDNCKDEDRFVDLLNHVIREEFSTTDINLSNENLFGDSSVPTFVYKSITKENSDFVMGYTEINSRKEIFNYVSENLNMYNKESMCKPMDLVFFDYAINHICRIIRIFQLKRSNMLLIGIGGRGKQSLTRIAAYMSKIEFFTFEVSKSSKLADFRENLKIFYRKCGLENKRLVLYLTDSHFFQESTLIDVCDMLQSNDICGLFAPDEMASIISSVKMDALAMDTKESDADIWNFFLTRVKDNMHIVIAMSPSGKKLFINTRNYPALVSHTTINWLNGWPNVALEQVAIKHLKEETNIDDIQIVNLTKCFIQIHEDAVHIFKKETINNIGFYHVTPEHFLEFLRNYHTIYDEKKISMIKQSDKLSTGLSNLEIARAHVEKMRIELEDKKMIVIERQKDCESLLEKIVKDKSEAEKRKLMVEQESVKISSEEKRCKEIASEAESELSMALPALEEAMLQVDILDKSAVTEIKCYSKPPAAVEKVLSCVMTFFGKDKDWVSAKKVISETNFLGDLKRFDKDNIDKKVLVEVGKIIHDHTFAADDVSKVSKAAGALCAWCHAIYIYAQVAKDVSPKRAKLKEALSILASKQVDLKNAENDLELLIHKTEKLKIQYDKSVATKNTLTIDANNLEDKLHRAEDLVLGLDVEYHRWKQSICDLKSHLDTLSGDSILASALISYAGPFDPVLRKLFLSRCVEVVRNLMTSGSSSFSLANFLGNISDIQKWNMQGLPKDEFSVDNAIIGTYSTKWSIFVDPQLQANKWIKEMEGTKLQINDPQDASLLRDIENAMQFGLPLLLQNISEDFDSTLEPLIRQEFFKVDGRRNFKFGSKVIECSDSFRLYMTTKLVHPSYSPEMCGKTKIINFSVTEKGLKEQFLSLVVNEEEPSLEQGRINLVISINTNKLKLIELEDNILHQLSSATGNLLDDDTLVKALKLSKVTADDIDLKLRISEETTKKIECSRDLYKSSADLSAVIFFCLLDLSFVEPVYQFSLDSHISQFKQSIALSRINNIGRKCSNVTDRVEEINKCHMLQVFHTTCIGLFEKDRLLFPLQLCLRLMMEKGELDLAYYNLLYKGHLSENKHKNVELSTVKFEWMRCDQNKHLVQTLIALIPGLFDSFVISEQSWIHWLKCEKPETSPLPDDFDCKLTPLQRLCLIRVLRVDRLIETSSQLISSYLGPEYANPPILDIIDVFGTSNSVSPLVFLLSEGVDPLEIISSLARSKGIELIHISLGQGQIDTAKDAIRKASTQGKWVYLANCHLMNRWMSELDALVDELASNEKNIHNDYRLWLSSLRNVCLPISILQRSVKISLERSKGLRSNMIRLSKIINPYQATSWEKGLKFVKLLHALSWFHAILLERRKFHALGFNASYDFSDSDYLFCHDILIDLLDKYQDDDISFFQAFRYLVGIAIYGGRVTDSWDQRLVNVYAETILSPDCLKPPFLDVMNSSCSTEDINLIELSQNLLDNISCEEDLSAFGQNSNANIASKIEDSNSLIDSLRLIKLDKAIDIINIGDENSKETNEIIIFERLRLLPESLDFRDNERKIGFETNPYQIVLQREVDGYNGLLFSIRTILSEIDDALKGRISMTSSLEEIINNISNDKVPDIWLEFYPSCKPIQTWLDDLHKRIDQLQTWIFDNKPPSVIWLPGLINPNGFLTAILQTFSRKKDVPFDNLSFEFVVSRPDEQRRNEDEIEGNRIFEEAAEDGYYIHGLVLEGARWNKELNCIDELLPMEFTSSMPIIHFKPIEITMKNRNNRNDQSKNGDYGCHIYKCPLYLYPNRAGTFKRPSYLTTIDINGGQENSDHWVKRGVALLLSTST